MDTVRCLNCCRRAKTFTGHVHRGKEKIISGWCVIHSASVVNNRTPMVHCVGCDGEWRKRDGLQLDRHD